MAAPAEKQQKALSETCTALAGHTSNSQANAGCLKPLLGSQRSCYMKSQPLTISQSKGRTVTSTLPVMASRAINQALGHSTGRQPASRQTCWNKPFISCEAISEGEQEVKKHQVQEGHQKKRWNLERGSLSCSQLKTWLKSLDRDIVSDQRSRKQLKDSTVQLWLIEVF